MTSTTLVLKQGDKGAFVLENEFQHEGTQQSITIYAGDASIALIADAASAKGFFTALHDATARIIDRLTLARLEAKEATNKVCSE